MALEHGLDDGVEEGFVGPARRSLSPADGGQHLAGAGAGLRHIERPSIADDFPDALAPMLAVDEEALSAGGQHPDAEALELGVSDVEGGLAWHERRDASVGQIGSGHSGSPGCGCNQGSDGCGITSPAAK